MTRLLSGLVPLLVFCSAYADDDVANIPAPPIAPNVVGIAIFLILFVGMCAGFFFYIWRQSKQKKPE